ncbi:histone-like nucleoid-structuring protein Lsr2 [Mycobacteroides abscessus]|uniref:histone-like nucleoid-structuring protein Lsr2 n=1 Tax=Mycobacteroides abscessus TaxID=36809 RepID=UPI000C26788E|nr:Lsr2 family protein [Mycobacteroides abscessus]
MTSRNDQPRIDDFDGTISDKIITTTFSLGKDRYEIDLHPRNQALLEAALKPFIRSARRAGYRRGPYNTKAIGAEDPQAVRAWAQARGIPVSNTGRLRSELIDAYNSAMRDSPDAD